MSWSGISEHYAQLLARHGVSHRALDWGSRESQQLRFSVLSEVGELRGCSVLDVGCGLADFWEFLRARGIEVDYTGVDLSPQMIAKAADRFPGLRLIAGNVLESDLPAGGYDYVIASGIFTFLGESEAEDHAVRLIEKLYGLARRAAAFNALSTWAPERAPGEFQLDPVAVLARCRELCPRVVLRHDYLAHDFSVYLYRDRGTR